MRFIGQMQIKWKTNEEMPVPDDYHWRKKEDPLYNKIAWYELIVYSEKYDFFGELYFEESYTIPFQRDVYPAIVRNEDGFFLFEWKFVTKWIYKRELKAELLQ